MLIKNITKLQRPREKAFVFGINVLSDVELLAIILKTGTKEQGVLQLAQVLLNNLGLNRLLDFQIHDLLKIKGIGKVKALELLTIIEISKRIFKEQIKQKSQISQKDILNLMFKEFKAIKRELFYLIGLNSQNELVLFKKLFSGATNFCVVDPKIILQELINNQVHHFYCFHNHPANSLKPSPDDILTTRQIEFLAANLNIKLIEHFIITNCLALGIISEKKFKENELL